MERIMNSEDVYVFKIIIVGDPGVGKTSLLLRYIENRFSEEYLSTIGVDFYIQTLNIEENEVKLQIWDTGGQEKFSYMRPGYYIGAVGAVIVYDATQPSSFQSIKKWIDEVEKYCPNIPLIVAENKVDLPRKVSRDAVKRFVNEFKLPIFETSAKDNLNVTNLFRYFAQMLLSLRIEPKKLEIFNTLTPDEITENYRKCSERAVQLIRERNYDYAIKALEKAFAYSNGIGFQAGIDWVQEQIIFISQLISEEDSSGIPPTTTKTDSKQTLGIDGLEPYLEKPELITNPIVSPAQRQSSTILSILDSIRDKLVFGVSLNQLLSRLKNAHQSIIQVYEINEITDDMQATINELSSVKDSYTLINPEVRNKLFNKIYEWKNKILRG